MLASVRVSHEAEGSDSILEMMSSILRSIRDEAAETKSGREVTRSDFVCLPEKTRAAEFTKM